MKALSRYLAPVCAMVALTSSAVFSAGYGEYYHEDFNSGSSLTELGFQNVSYWDLDAADGVMRSSSPGGWGSMSSCQTEALFLNRAEDDITISWSLRFPTDNSIVSWRENNKTYLSVLQESGLPAYKLTFKPNRVQDCYTSPDLILEDGNGNVVAQAHSHQPAPAGEDAAFVNFLMTFKQDGRILVSYNSKNGEGMVELIDETDLSFNQFFGIKVEQKTGSGSKNFFVEVGRMAVIDDADGDGVPDAVEIVAGTNPNNADDAPVALSEGTYLNETAQDGGQWVAFDMTNTDKYSRCSRIPVHFPENSITSDFIPLTKMVEPGALPAVQDGYDIDGDYQEIEGTIASGKKVLYAFPISDENIGIPAEFMKLSYFNEGTGEWEDVEIEYVTYNAIYAYVEHFSTYVALVQQQIYRVFGGFESEDPENYKFKTIASAIEHIGTTNENQQCVILVAGAGEYGDGQTFDGEYSESKLLIGKNIAMLGGFNPSGGWANMGDAKQLLAENEKVIWDSKKFETIISASSEGYRILTIFGAGDDSFQSVVDGFTFKGAHTESGSDIQNGFNHDGAVGIISSSHITDIEIRNCKFIDNFGLRAGALYLYNASKIIIKSCFFVNNTANNSGTHFPYAASAINLFQDPVCGAGAKLESCVFYNNHITGGSGATIVNYGYPLRDDIIPRGDLLFHNCTFHSNTTAAEFPYCVYNGEECNNLVAVRNSIIDEAGKALSDDIRISGNFIGNADFVADGNAVGPDLIWGTADDGLNLKSSAAACINKAENIYAPQRDACDRQRWIGRAAQNVDIGAYEKYTRVLCIGEQNIIGYGGENFRSFLKAKAAISGYLFDFVGRNSSAPRGEVGKAWTLEEEAALGEDPQIPNSNAYDISHFGILDNARQGFINDDFTEAKLTNEIASTKPEIQIITLGARDAAINKRDPETEILADIRTVVNSVGSASRKTIVTTLVTHENGKLKPLIDALNEAISVEKFEKAGVHMAEVVDINGDSPIIPITENYADKAGYEQIATKIWAKLSTMLSSK